MSSMINTPGLANVVAMVRDGGNIVPVHRRDDGTGLSNGRPHIRAIYDERGRDKGKPDRAPLHSVINDVRTEDGIVMALMRSEVPEAAQIVADYGSVRSRADAEKLEQRYFDLGRDWRNTYLQKRRRDANPLFLQFETLVSLGKMIEVQYQTPTIENAFPITVLGTELTTGRATEKEVTWELPVYGVDVSISGLPTADLRRGERFYNLVTVSAAAKITDEEIRRFEEIAANYPDDFDFTLWDDYLKGAARSVQFGVAATIAYGRPQNQVDGLFRRKNALPQDNYDFTTANPADNLAAINKLLADQFAQVDSDPEMQADSLALSPSTFLKLSQELFNGQNASNMMTMEMIMRANPQIKTIFQIREAEPNANMVARLKDHNMSQEEAEINSGGLRVSGTQRNTAIAFRRDPKFIEILKGFNLRTTVYPPVWGVTQAKLVESVGGLVVHQPQTVRIGYEDA